jgi:alkylhydroperoxidase family enzyme
MLVSLLKTEAVPFEALHARYGGLLELVRTLIGVVPNCDPYLEIWPAAFRTYNVMVPNFLNLPVLVWGLGAPADLVGLAMYASSRTAGCMYCSAHTCSFALRRGAAPARVAGAADADLSGRPPAERAAIAAARAMSEVPERFTGGLRRDLEAAVGRKDAEWIACGVMMMGFLNKMMDALGVELEASTHDEVDALIAPSGWTPGQHGPADGPRAARAGAAPPRRDSLGTKLGVVRFAPGALALDKKWTAGVPDRWPAVGEYLRAKTGHDFPVLGRIGPRRVVRALGAMLRDNLDAQSSVTGVARKLAAGVVYAQTVGDAALEAQLAKLGRAEPDAAIEAVARAVAPSPARVDDAVIAQARTLAPAALVEVVTFVSLMQLVHRAEAFHAAG